MRLTPLAGKYQCGPGANLTGKSSLSMQTKDDYHYTTVRLKFGLVKKKSRVVAENESDEEDPKR